MLSGIHRYNIDNLAHVLVEKVENFTNNLALLCSVVILALYFQIYNLCTWATIHLSLVIYFQFFEHLECHFQKVAGKKIRTFSCLIVAKVYEAL